MAGRPNPVVDGKKRCPRCERTLAIDLFGRTYGKPSCYCKECLRAEQKKYREPRAWWRNYGLLDAAAAHRLFTYDPETGVLRRKEATTGNARAGDAAGHLDAKGYIKVCVLGKPRGAHQIVWLMMTGEWPPALIDHKNRNTSDNRWSNLRLASYGQNSANRGLGKNSGSGFKGVTLQRKHGTFKAAIKVNGKNIHLGCFTTAEEAHAAYASAATMYFGEYARAA